MTAIKPAYAVCIKLTEIYDQVLGKLSELVPGEFVKIDSLNKENSNYVIKVYNPETQNFRKKLYQCGQTNIKCISDDVWNSVNNLRLETKVILSLELPCGKKNIMFLIKFYGSDRLLGVGRFFGLEIIDESTQVTELVKNQIRMKYYKTNQSLNMIRADKLIEALVLDKMTTASIAATTPSNRKPQAQIPVKPIKQFLPEENDTETCKLVNPPKKPSYHKNSPKKDATKTPNKINCYNCHKPSANKIKFDCQHIFCCHCLVNIIGKDLEKVYCPFRNGKYKCSFRLKLEDIQRILDEVKNHLAQPNNYKGKVIKKESAKHKNIPNVARIYSGKVIEPNSQQTRQNKISNVTGFRGQNNLAKPKNMPKSTPKNQHTRLTITANLQYEMRHNSYEEEGATASCVVSNDVLEIPAWTCIYCNYGENLMDTAICILCLRTNDHDENEQHSSANEYYRLLELEQTDTYIPNFDEFECIICYVSIEPEDGVQLRGCLHNVCSTCIVAYIESQNQAEIKCPYSFCNNILEDREIKTLISQTAFNRHMEISLRIGKLQIQNGYQCCVLNCPGYWIFTDRNYKYNCPICRTENCISCKASHPRIDCKTYQQNLFYLTDKNGIETRLRLEQMLKTGEAEHCPTCNIIVVRNGGCHQMVCSMCQQAFQWGSENANGNLNLK